MVELDEFEKKAIDFIAKKVGVDPKLVKVHSAEHAGGGAIVAGTFSEVISSGPPEKQKYTRWFKVKLNGNLDVTSWKASANPIDE